MSEVPL